VSKVSAFCRRNRIGCGFTQRAFAAHVGVGLRFIRDLEQGKSNLRMDKVNQVLLFFGFQLGPVVFEEDDPEVEEQRQWKIFLLEHGMDPNTSLDDCQD